MTAKVISLIGLARRAGFVCSGEAQVEALMKKKKGKLLIIAGDSPGAASKFGKWAESIKMPVIIAGNKKDLGLAIGLSPRSVILIMDNGFAEAIMKARS